jgi:hypothetical protein
MWTEVSSSAPHFLQSGLSISPIKWRCLYRVLCPVRSPVTALDWSILSDKYLALVPLLGPEINSRACRWERSRSCHPRRCWFTSQRTILLLRSHFETPKARSGLQTHWPCHSSRACPLFHCLSLQHARQPNRVPQHAWWRYHSVPPLGMLF